MARTRTTTTREILPDETPDASSPGDELEQPIVIDYSEDTSQILARMSGYVFRIHKQAIDGKMDYCDKVASDEIEDLPEYLQKKHNGGKYTVRAFQPGKMRPSYVLHLRIANRTPEQNTPNNSTESAASVEARLLRENMLFTQQMMLRMLENRGNNSSLSEIAEVLRVLRPEGGLSGDGALNLVMKGMDIANKAAGGMDWKTELIAVGKEQLPAILDALKTLKAPTPVPGQTPVPTQEPMTKERALKLAIAYLKSQIIANTYSVDLAIDLAVANAANPQYAPLLDYVLTTDYAELVKLDGDLDKEPYKAWFTAFQQGLREHYADTGDTSDDDTTGTDGNMGNAKGNGAVSAGRGKVTPTR